MNKDKLLQMSKYITFSLLFVLNIVNIYFFLLRSWNSRDMLYYTDPNFMGNFDLQEFFFGYVSGWLIIFILSLFQSIIDISQKTIKAFLWLIIPFSAYNTIFFAYQLMYNAQM